MQAARGRTRDELFDEAFLRKLERLEIVARKVRAGILRGERRSLKRGQSVEFADFRTYSHGDDLRRVDWNVYARFERAFIKLFVEEEDRTVHVILDTSPSMDWGDGAAHKLTFGRRTAAALGYIALGGLDRVALATAGAGLTARSPSFRGTGALFRLFDFLATDAPAWPTAGQGTDLDAALAEYATRARNPGPLFLISDLLGAGSGGGRSGLTALRAHGYEPNLIHTLSPDELDPPLRGELRLVDRETGAARELTVDDAALARYRRGLDAWRDDLAGWCGGRSIPYLPVDTGTPFEDLLLTTLQRGGMVA
ncbi:MAG: hypothetical protein AVDCRST_MAG88-872 [uncultured Thermomicrobiales bacterium]|uniref:DUF58 domain-containing protein n=1 Tax=uncultured Thermomicrobiales bacterium TaxID=1645740 RepID=A0A6J4ULA0_9BACT|nr:MAG: hypothetical protein AVDCRST_MAG88-872 [uncultured Thermomicrobiales bacterium]